MPTLCLIALLVQSFYDNKGVNLKQIARNDSSPFLCSLRCSIQHIKSLEESLNRKVLKIISKAFMHHSCKVGEII